MLNYYLNLPKEKELDFNKNINVSVAIQKTARRAFEPFESYLTNAIRVLKKKDDVKAKWQKVKSENHAELRIIGKLFEISNGIGQYKIVADIVQPDFSEPIIYKIGEKKGKITITKEQYQSDIIQLDTDTENFDRVTWSGDDIELQPLWLNEQQEIDGIVIREENRRKIVYSENSKKTKGDAKEISGNKIVSFIDFDNLRLENGEKLDAERNDGLSLLLSHERDYNKVVSSNKIKFKIERPQKRDKDSFWIQLHELDDTTQGEDIPGFSPLRYFFDDDISIFDDKKNEYEVSAGRESENKIVLTKKGERYKYCFPPENSILTVKVNTYQLRKQLEAISTLMKMPVREHGKLIKLFENRERTTWETPTTKCVADWAVITDETRSGCKEQRHFVNQALNTPDFAILEGPPGSGKTTVILELICQLAKQGKRILLCGSTHVAIDNVLERLKAKKVNEQSLLEQYHILPVRIGDEKRINDDIREFQIDNLQHDNEITEKLLLDAANLVCGTTIGILQHPNFKQRQGKLNEEKLQYYSDTPIVPEFDYLIIDESSKTTFQEFLVPALYAKKWILAGDVMQLSPFTDREEIVSNISQLQVENKPLKFELQQAIFYLQKLKTCLHGRYNKFVLPVNMDIFNFMELELSRGRYNDFYGKTIFAVTNEGENVDNEMPYKRNINTVNNLELSAADVILIDESLLKQIFI
jgi:DNA polymerase III delta prime subunit